MLEFPPWTETGFTDTLSSVAGVIVRVADWVEDPIAAEIVALTFAETADVLIVNVAVADPAATVTVAGTEADALLDVKFTTVPPFGALPVSVTVPVEGLPPGTDVGERVMLLTPAGLIVRVAVTEVLPSEAVIVALVTDETLFVLTVKVAVVEPAATVTVAGTVALPMLDFRFTRSPPAGA